MSQDHTRLPPTRGEGQGLTADVVKADVRTYEYTAWCILNPYGDPWGPEWFEEPAEALAHLQQFWGANHHLTNGFSFALAEITVKPIVGTEIVTVAAVRSAAGQSLTEASVYGSSPLINEAHPPGANSHEG